MTNLSLEDDNRLMDYWTRIIARMRSLVKSEMPLGFYFNFTDFGFNLLNKSEIIGCGQLVDGLYCIIISMEVLYIYDKESGRTRF